MNKHINHAVIKSVFCFGIVLVMVLSPFVFTAPTQTANPHQPITLSIVHAQAAAPATPDFWTEPFGWVGDKISSGFSWVVREVFAILAGLLIKLGVTVLAISSGLFEMLVDRTIIGFGDTNGILSQGAINSINTAWTAFRDLSNILIIGFFTFIAINIILGSPTFGAKKLIARVLIVAILINFSLLFTKIIIDFSNYTATQFYNASIGKPPAAGGTPEGIGARLTNLMGVTSFGGAVAQIADRGERDGIAAMIVYALFSFAVLIGAAFVLFYGSFILASRAILLVFLMITAALAFASHLLPYTDKEENMGWAMWRTSLLKSAVLAPILMIFLWATLSLAKALQTANGSLGDLPTNPTNAGDLGSLFSYLIILGLLFASFKVANSFSTNISGFNWASVVPAMGIATGVRFAGFTGQQIGGRVGLAASNRLSNAASNITSQSRMAQLGRGMLYGAAGGMAALAGSRRGGGGAAGEAIASNVEKTGLNRSNLFPGRNALPGASAAQQAAQQSAANAIKDAFARSQNRATTGGAPTPAAPPAGTAPPTRPTAQGPATPPPAAPPAGTAPTVRPLAQGPATPPPSTTPRPGTAPTAKPATKGPATPPPPAAPPAGTAPTAKPATKGPATPPPPAAPLPPVATSPKMGAATGIAVGGGFGAFNRGATVPRVPPPATKPQGQPAAGALGTPHTGGATVDTARIEATLRQEAQERTAADRKAADEKAANAERNNANMTKELTRAVASSNKDAANETGRQISGALKDQGEETRASMEHTARETSDRNEGVVTKLGEEIKHVGTQFGEATTAATRGTADVVKNVQQTNKENLDTRAKQTETAAKDEAMKAGAVAERTRSETRTRDYEVGQRIAGAKESAQRATERMANLRVEQQMLDHYIPPANSSSQSAPLESGVSGSAAASFAQPYAQSPGAGTSANETLSLAQILRNESKLPEGSVKRLKDSLLNPTALKSPDGDNTLAVFKAGEKQYPNKLP